MTAHVETYSLPAPAGPGSSLPTIETWYQAECSECGWLNIAFLGSECDRAADHADRAANLHNLIEHT